MQKEKRKRTGLVGRYLGVGLTVELDLGLALDMAGEVTAHAPGGSGVVESPNQVTAEVAPSRVERSNGLENMACGNDNEV